jgi:hypothetical protein
MIPAIMPVHTSLERARCEPGWAWSSPRRGLLAGHVKVVDSQSFRSGSEKNVGAAARRALGLPTARLGEGGCGRVVMIQIWCKKHEVQKPPLVRPRFWQIRGCRGLSEPDAAQQGVTGGPCHDNSAKGPTSLIRRPTA